MAVKKKTPLAKRLLEQAEKKAAKQLAAELRAAREAQILVRLGSSIHSLINRINIHLNRCLCRQS